MPGDAAYRKYTEKIVTERNKILSSVSCTYWNSVNDLY